MENCAHKINSKQSFKRYELKPIDGQQKSFYKKAFIEEYENGEKVLYSYDVPIARILPNGVFFKLWNKWSATTARHLKAAIGRPVPKSEWERLKLMSD